MQVFLFQCYYRWPYFLFTWVWRRLPPKTFAVAGESNKCPIWCGLRLPEQSVIALMRSCKWVGWVKVWRPAPVWRQAHHVPALMHGPHGRDPDHKDYHARGSCSAKHTANAVFGLLRSSLPEGVALSISFCSPPTLSHWVWPRSLPT